MNRGLSLWTVDLEGLGLDEVSGHRRPRDVPSVALVVPVLFPVHLVVAVEGVNSVFQGGYLGVSAVDLAARVPEAIEGLPV